MPAISLLSKAAAVAVTLLSLAGTSHAGPTGFSLQQRGDRAATGVPPIHVSEDNPAHNYGWTRVDHRTLGQKRAVPNNQDDQVDTSFKVLTHKAFPKYAIRYKSSNLCDPNVKQASGYLDVDSDKHFFFWFFESRNKPKEDPLILWLNGGPGCSSMSGLFTELGPCRVNENGDGTDLNENSWNSNANIIFLDQPLNAGYSYGSGGPQDSHAAAEDVHAFLQLFFKEFPDYASLDFHVAGESYAGHYIPAIGSVLHSGKQVSASSEVAAINLKSLMIGNGLTDPLVQYKYYPQMACNNTYEPVLDQSTCNQMEQAYPDCAALIKKCYDSPSQSTCEPAYNECNNAMLGPFQYTGKNPYDVRKECEDNNLCYKIESSMEKYLNRPDVMKAIGAKVDKFVSCNTSLVLSFSANDWMRPYVNDVPPLLEDGIRVLIYAGDADFICNWMGNKAWTTELPWSGHDEFAAAEDTKWTSPTANKEGGELRKTKDGKFAFLRVFGAGHMVPMDQGEFALDMVNQWVQGKLA